MDPSAEPSIRINADCTNSGQFFACCGLLELADRLWPGAEGWFEQRHFCIACDGTLDLLMYQLTASHINSSLTDEELKRLGTLMSAAKTSLTPEQASEKDQLRSMWQSERLHLGMSFNLCLDWWRGERGARTELKTWAAKQFVLEIARPLLRSLPGICAEECFQHILHHTAKVEALPFYFDSDVNSQNTPRDIGFALYCMKRW